MGMAVRELAKSSHSHGNCELCDFLEQEFICLAADLLAVKEAFEKYRETYCPWEQTLSS